MEVNLVNSHQIPEMKKLAGWMALASTSKEVDFTKVYNHCVRSGHWTPTRQINFIFELKGLSRVCTHQLVRHTEGVHIVQESQRYVEMTDKTPAVLPPAFAKDEAIFFEEYGLWITPSELIHLTRSMYKKLVEEMDFSYEDARYILTGAEPSVIRLAVSPEALIHLANLRLCVRAAAEIHQVVFLMVKAALDVAPELAHLLVPKCEYTLCCDEVNTCGKFPPRSVAREILKKEMVARIGY